MKYPHPLDMFDPVIAQNEMHQIAIDAYIYAYPAVLLELTRRVALGRPNTNMNRFTHRRVLHDASFTDVVRPNADTLYSAMWFDLREEPLVIRIPESRGRYFLLQILDQWSDTFAAPGTRATGLGSGRFVLAGPGWRGDLPEDVTLIRSPTASGWIIGRTQTRGPDDYASVHAFQNGITSNPLSKPDGSWTAIPSLPDSTWNTQTPPMVQIESLDARNYFGLLSALIEHNPPHANDWSIVQRMAMLGLRAGQPFTFDTLPAEVKQAFEQAAAVALPRIKSHSTQMGVLSNGWRTLLTAVGTYGTDYLSRAAVAWLALGANSPEDAVYPFAFTDSEGRPLTSLCRYQLHFSAQQIPPVRGFWSLTVYDERQLFASNSINRYSIGDRDALQFNSDGSLDIFIQRDAPLQSEMANWLPAPSQGEFSMNLRLFWPDPSVLDGRWIPPALIRLD